MKFQITSQAREYLTKKNKRELTIEQYTPKMCCGSGSPSLVCYMGPPKEKSATYTPVTVECYKIYIDPRLDFSNHIVTITTEQYLMMHSLAAVAKAE